MRAIAGDHGRIRVYRGKILFVIIERLKDPNDKYDQNDRSTYHMRGISVLCMILLTV